jgi:hypothetical protein
LEHAAKGAIADLGNAIRAQIDGYTHVLRRSIHAVAAVPAKSTGKPVGAVPVRPGGNGAAKVAVPALPSRARPAAANSDLSTPMLKVLGALAFWGNLGFERASREQVAVVAGYFPTSGGFANLLGKLSTAGLISYPVPGDVALTQEGGAVAYDDRTGSVRERMGSVLSAPQLKIVDALLGIDGQISREGLGDATGYSPTSGGFANLLGKLSTMGLIGYPAKGCVALQDWVRL